MMSMSRAEGSSERRYWVWVTGPEYYLDDNGADRADLQPRRGYEPGGWWSCHRDTQAGDLVLLYRSRKRKDIAYLIEARSAAYSILNDRHAQAHGWDYGCDYQVLVKFPSPLPLAAMQNDPALADWGALRAGFRRKVYAIQPDTWTRLLQALGYDDPKMSSMRRRAQKLFALEREIEEHLADDLRPFAPHHYDLELRARQYVCRFGGRADLVCWDRAQQRHVVIELKRGLITRDAVAQVLSYMASIQDEYRPRKRPSGLVVGERLDNEANGMIRQDKRLEFIAVDQLVIRG
jgi:predicted RNA-binding protein with PUA-like domain